MKHFYLRRLFLIILAIIGITNFSFAQTWEIVDEYDLTSKEGGKPVLEDPISISKNLGSYSYRQIEGNDYYTLYYLAAKGEYFSIRYNLSAGQYRFSYKIKSAFPDDSPFDNPVDFFYSYGSEKTILGEDVSLPLNYQDYTYEFTVENEGNHYLGFAPEVPEGAWGGYYLESLKLEKFTEGEGSKYEEPTYETSGKPFEDYTDTYVKKITLTKGSEEKSWTHTERKFWNVIPELTISATAGETISAHFEANSLGAYNESNALQDIRFTAVVLSIDWDGDGVFEYAQKIKGKTPPVHNVGGNAMSSQEELDNSKAQNKPATFDPDWYVMDYTYDIEIPEDARTGTARVRFNYTNAWKNKINEVEESDEDFAQRNINSSKEGIIYDFDIKVTEKALSSYTINIEENEHARIYVKDGDGRINNGDKVAEGKELTVEVVTDPGYKVESVMAGDTDITEDLKFTVTKDITVKAVVVATTYMDLSYTVTGDEEAFIEKIGFYNENNQLLVNKQILKGEKYSLRIYPKGGNKDIEISALLNQNPVDLNFDDSEKAFIYEGIADRNQIFTINLPTYYVVNITPNEHATITVKDGDKAVENGDKVRKGTELTVEVNADPDYKVSKVMAGNTDITTTLKFTVTEDVTISAVVVGTTYFDLEYNVVGNEEAFIEKIEFYNGSNELIDNNKILKGENYSIRIYPKEEVNEDFEISAELNQKAIELKFDESKKAFIYEGTAEENQIFTIKVHSFYIVNIAPNKHATITVKDGDQAIESGDKVAEGTELTVDVKPESGYKLISVKAGKEDITEKLVFTVSENVTVVATVEAESAIGSVNVSGIYYNPAEQVLYTNGAKAVIYDMAGRVVANETGNISVSDFADGIYTAIVNGVSYKFKK